MPDFLIHYLNMGGYGHFIWSAYGLSAVIIIGLIIQSRRFLKSTEIKLQSLTEKEYKNETET